jgi:hypothetical protein
MKMRNEIVTFLNDLGIGWKYLIGGFLGALTYSIHKKSSFWQSCRQIFVGSLISGYSTPLIASKLSLASTGFISFTLGMVGMVFIEMLIGWISKKLKLLF